MKTGSLLASRGVSLLALLVSVSAFSVTGFSARTVSAAELVQEGTASYKGAPGDVILLDIKLKSGLHLNIQKDPSKLIGHQMMAMPSAESDQILSDAKDGAQMELCTGKKNCKSLSGVVVIERLTGEDVAGHIMTMGDSRPGNIAFSARVAEAQNPLLTGGLETLASSVPRQRITAINFDIRTRMTGTIVLSRGR